MCLLEVKLKLFASSSSVCVTEYSRCSKKTSQD